MFLVCNFQLYTRNNPSICVCATHEKIVSREGHLQTWRYNLNCFTKGANQHVGFMMHMGVNLDEPNLHRWRWASLLPGSRCLLIVECHKRSIFGKLEWVCSTNEAQQITKYLKICSTLSCLHTALIVDGSLQYCCCYLESQLCGGSKSCSKCREAVEVWHKSEGIKLVCGHGQLLCRC